MLIIIEQLSRFDMLQDYMVKNLLLIPYNIFTTAMCKQKKRVSFNLKTFKNS
jgi:hypothetical protein